VKNAHERLTSELSDLIFQVKMTKFLDDSKQQGCWS